MLHQQTKPHLSWLFVAFFKDGTQITQTQADEPKEQPEGSAFSDVAARMDDLAVFELRHEDGQQVITVDLQTGAFVLNGTPFHAHNQAFKPENYPLKLVYFRETRVDQRQLATVQDDMSVKTESLGAPDHYVNRYFVGWETEVHGKNKQVTIAVG